ncbi:hypothetical protein OG455_35445 [Kitasatospora sp. NBC_01287]|uniref:hypothetical protein n=1 Tax=Kitasatospora sp. NBC_01287 TaxID=2903573 RepID=UPI00225BFA82|nr:hypothetical protein [Kitasatospora sp. NBC_01287]MCX4750741.1 hypothetical protein [Kitasatospora sp. NBC_01287]
MNTGRAAVVGMVSLMALATGCGSAGSGSDGTGAKAAPPTALALLPQKLDKPAGPYPDLTPSPSPAHDATFSENLEFELRRRTLAMTLAPGETSAQCPKDLDSKAGTTVACTVTYDSLDLVWDVALGDKAAWSDNYVTYQAQPRQGILTRDGLALYFYGNFSPDEVRCNNVPTAVLVPLNQLTDYACQTVSGGRPGTADKVRITDSGPLAG